MKKPILRLLIEIPLVITFVIVSLPLWNVFAARMPNVEDPFAGEGTNLRMALIREFQDINTSESGLIIVCNQTNRTASGELIFKFAKSSSLAYQYLNIDVNKTSYRLESIYSGEDDEFYLFILDQIELAKYSNQEYEIRIWLNNPKINFANETYDYGLTLV